MFDRFQANKTPIIMPPELEPQENAPEPSDKLGIERVRGLFEVGAKNLGLCALDVMEWRRREAEGENIFGRVNYRRIE